MKLKIELRSNEELQRGILICISAVIAHSPDSGSFYFAKSVKRRNQFKAILDTWCARKINKFSGSSKRPRKQNSPQTHQRDIYRSV
jgi:tRNA G18 (ribose-2'-O)-methylase SpoU